MGYQTAEALAKQGHKVYGAARRVDRMEPLKASGVVPVKMDVTDEASIDAGLKQIIDAEGRIDVLINNAGSGSYGTNLENDLPDMIRSLKGRIHFAHVRNLKFNSPTDFEESAHLSSDGTFDMYEIMLALYDIGFDGPIRPDHGRMIWDEVAMPGYGLYDRALGATYLNGLWEAICKSHK